MDTLAMLLKTEAFLQASQVSDSKITTKPNNHDSIKRQIKSV